MQNNGTKFWKWFALLLAALNITLLVSVWFHPFHPHDRMMPPPPPGEGPKDFIIHELKFSDQQIEAFSKLRNAHHDSVEQLREQGNQLRKLFFDNLKNETVSDSLVQQQSFAIAENQGKIEWITFKHFQEVKKLCDEKQKQKFDEIIGDVLRKMAGPPQPPPPPPHEREKP